MQLSHTLKLQVDLSKVDQPQNIMPESNLQSEADELDLIQLEGIAIDSNLTISKSSQFESDFESKEDGDSVCDENKWKLQKSPQDEAQVKETKFSVRGTVVRSSFKSQTMFFNADNRNRPRQSSVINLRSNMPMVDDEEDDYYQAQIKDFDAKPKFSQTSRPAKLFFAQTQRLGKDNLNSSAYLCQSEIQNSDEQPASDESQKEFKSQISTSKYRLSRRSKTQSKKPYGMTQTNQTALSFPNMCLKFVTINMFNMNLQSIDFSSNKLVSIPNEIVEIPYLRVLKLQNNHIARMPAETCRLTNLTQLILSNNKLKAVFPQIDRLHSLEVLLLDNNQISVIPLQIGSLSNLKKLHLHENLICYLPRAISKLTNLNEFAIEWFLYTRPSNSRIQKNPEVIKSIRDFCAHFKNVGQQSEDQPQIQRKHSLTRQINASIGSQLKVASLSDTVSFCDFIVQYNKLPHQFIPDDKNAGHFDDILFTPKKRTILHFTASNQHTHLFSQLLKKEQGYQRVDVNKVDINQVSVISMLIMNLDVPKYELEDDPNRRKLLMIEMLYDLVSLNTSDSKVCPLYWSIFKHQFGIAKKLIEKGADCSLRNQNQSNLLHILFSNFDGDLQLAPEIADLILKNPNVDANKIDLDGKSPLHVAIKKQQTQALVYAKTKFCFDFNVKGRGGFNPLQYAVKKSNTEAFMLLMDCCNLLDRTVDFLTARQLSCINSCYYRILKREEKVYARKKIQEIGLLSQKVTLTKVATKPSKSQKKKKPESRNLNIRITDSSVGNPFQTNRIPVLETSQDGSPGIPLLVQNNMLSSKNQHGQSFKFIESIREDGAATKIQVPGYFSVKNNRQMCQRQNETSSYNTVNTFKAIQNPLLPTKQADVIINHDIMTSRDVEFEIMPTPKLQTPNKKEMFEFTLGQPLNSLNGTLNVKEKWKAEQQKQKGGTYLKQKHLDVTMVKDQIDYEVEKMNTDEFPYYSSERKKSPARNLNSITYSPMQSKRSGTKNVFISTVNINLNLNINISIPPSPGDTARGETFKQANKTGQDIRNQVNQTLQDLRQEILDLEEEDNLNGENIETSFSGVTPAKPNSQHNSVKVMKGMYRPQQSYFDLNQLHTTEMVNLLSMEQGTTTFKPQTSRGEESCLPIETYDVGKGKDSFDYMNTLPVAFCRTPTQQIKNQAPPDLQFVLQNNALPMYLHYQALYQMIKDPKNYLDLQKMAGIASPIQSDIIFLVSVMSRNGVKIKVKVEQCGNKMAVRELANVNSRIFNNLPVLSDKLCEHLKTRDKKSYSTFNHLKQIKVKVPTSGVPRPGRAMPNVVKLKGITETVTTINTYRRNNGRMSGPSSSPISQLGWFVTVNFGEGNPRIYSPSYSTISRFGSTKRRLRVIGVTQTVSFQ